MTTSEFHVQALFDFAAEGSQDLSFQAGEILRITSTTAGHGWWYAQNSAGQVGAIPANYVEAIQEISPEPPRLPQEPEEKPSAQTDEQNVLGNNSSSLSFANQDPFDSVLQTQTSINEYITVDETSSPPNDFNSMSFLNPLPTEHNPISAQSNAWYFGTSKEPEPVQNGFPPFPSDPPSNYMSWPVTSTGTTHYINSTPAPEPVMVHDSSTAVFPTHTEERNILKPPAFVKDLAASSSPPTPPPASKATPETTPRSPTSAKTKGSGFFTLRRQKTKSDTEKRNSSFESSTEQRPTAGSDTDEFDDENPSTKTNTSESDKPSSGSNDAKGTPRPRFFDKHGIDNYLLIGCKFKPDEHVDIGYDEREGGVYWVPNSKMPPFSCIVEEPHKGTKFSGLKSYMEYKIHPQIPGGRVVGRRYKQFDWLHERLVNKFRFICIPPIPGKQIVGRNEQEFLKERRRQLEIWLNRICHHPVLCASFPVQHFVTCELTEKDNKDWKAGKRRSEKDELRESVWLHCVSFTTSNFSDTKILSQIEVFAQQQPGLETHLKNLSQGLAKYIERHTEVYERDIQRVGELFSKIHTVLQVDTTTPGSQNLSQAIARTSTSYNTIAEMYRTQASAGIRDYNERLQEYIGLLACFPLILSIQRSGAEAMRAFQQRSPAAGADVNGVLQRSHVLNHVVLAEINFFQKEKVNDLNLYTKILLNEQTQFYDKITTDLRQTGETFR